MCKGNTIQAATSVVTVLMSPESRTDHEKNFQLNFIYFVKTESIIEEGKKSKYRRKSWAD
ncbi:hypothetical protein VK70_23135 [Paenibacillus durus ATCC 35681]|uniref:Uncharacterized protein n=1 Tax=Paenibacillus durus ATCC 35681 TaxID=1333534 RepID=A0A0F7CK49_PAEDU|nr:hypothetical protein VK70_23135 [Paenibacillus durus ATCC 35681]